MKFKNKDTILLKDGRIARIHQVFANGNSYLVEIINSSKKETELPIISSDKIEKEIHICQS